MQDRHKYLLESHTDTALNGRGIRLAEVQNWGSNKTTAMETETIMMNYNSVHTTNPVATKIQLKEVMPGNLVETRDGVSLHGGRSL